MVPTESLGLENRDDDDCKYGQRNGFLDDFQLDEVEGSAVDGRADAVGRNHEGILEQGDTPRHKDDQKQRPILGTGDDFDEFELPVPGKSHENVGNDKQ